MKLSKIFTISAIFLAAFIGNNLAPGEAKIYDYIGECIQYRIKPIGKAEYNNFGTVDLKGVKANLMTLKGEALFFELTEKIYSNPESLLPYRTETSISTLWGKEYITEEYDQEKFTVVIRKFKGIKLVNEQTIKANGPIQNPVLVPFYMRALTDLKIGWHFTVRVPAEFKLELVSADEITVPYGKFQAYHFKSTPDKFEIWINKNTPRVPLKIKVKGIVNFTLSMGKYNIQ